MLSSRKTRLSDLLVERGLVTDLAASERAIIAGDVRIADTVITSPSALIDPEQEVILRSKGRFVSRGGDKLAGALEDLDVDPCALTCLDIGASTGGFTDCLLQNKASSVVAVDVGYGQFAWELRNDARVTLLERTNIRKIEPNDIGSAFDIIVADISFSQARSLFPLLSRLQEEGGRVLILVKPQFELPAQDVGSGGVVTNPNAHAKALALVIEAAIKSGYAPLAAVPSRLKGHKGNREFFFLAQLGGIPANIDVQAVAHSVSA